jgi:hypothetical protein
MSLTKADPNKQGWEDSVKCLISILQHNIYIQYFIYIGIPYCMRNLSWRQPLRSYGKYK